MTDSKTTKRALAASIGCMALCVVLLIGTTFAWFTDTASTSVNRIESGTLDVAIVDSSGNTLENLSFADYNSKTDILWEPGATFTTGEFYVKNNGSLALKYKLSIDGVDGDAGLLSAIDFSVVDSAGTDVDLSTFEGNLTADSKSSAYKIKAHMKESAGNECQGLSIDGIAITVVATQLNSEYDSYNNTYDQEAVYPVVSTFVKATASGTVSNASAQTVISDDNGTVEATIPANTLSVNDVVALTVDRTGMTADSVTFDIDFKVNNATPTSLSSPISVSVNVGTGLKNVKVTHGDAAMTEGTAGDQTYSYDATTGFLTIRTKTFSPFKIQYETDFAASVNKVGYASLVDALNAAKDGDTVTLQKDVDVKLNDTGSGDDGFDGTLWFGDATNVTFDLGGNTLTTVSNYGGSNNILNILRGWTIKNGEIVAMRADGTVDSYAIGFGYPGFTDCQVTIDNVQLNAGVAAYDGATVAMTNCSSAAGTNYYACYVEGGAKIVINDGKYTASNAKPIFYANNGSAIEVNAGQFYGEIAWTAGTGTVTIKGGTFDHDPSGYLASDYQATKSGDVWIVSAK